MPYCPNCRIQVAGNRCPRCGTALAQQPPPRPQQAYAAARPPPPPQQWQYQQPPPPTRPAQPYAQQPQAQPAYQVPSAAPAAAPTTPPKKPRKGMVIAVVCVVAILVIAMLAYLLLVTPEEKGIPTITYDELLNDLEVSGMTSVTFKSYDDGDELYITGTIGDIKMADVPPGTPMVSSGTWTIIYFESDNPLATVFNMFAYKGNIQSDFTIGEEGKIKIKIVEMSIMGYTMEYPKEWMDATTIQSYIEPPNVILQFTETSPGNYTGGITSDSDIVMLEDLDIEIYDLSETSTGWDDGDLTDDNPEVIDTWSGDLVLEFTDENNDDRLDPGDTFTLSYAETGDTITLEDMVTYETIVVYTVP